MRLVRPTNEVSYQLEQSIAAFRAEFPERKREGHYLRRATDLINSRIQTLPRTKPYYGMIHGDVIRANALVSEEGKVTVIDFDLCWPGWRAYDIASFLTTVYGTAEQKAFAEAFLDGYSTVRTLASLEQEAIPVFEAARAIFSIGVPAMNIYHWGKAYILPWLDDALERVEQCMKRLV